MIKNRIEAIFGYPRFNNTWETYFSDLNQAGKITAKSTLDIFTALIFEVEALEKEASLKSSEPKV